ncbi:C13 family peptidase [Chitiniphilus purpureus]|uniref:C13 family peptidase n=1 Tax=Chitiniphilus purpureus TaxID=2981137 RepID=A0ABY6DUE4_9NEIS|nr:C13 family peptidase [Chitiniphilus sp. CD1]UXY17126.1 C13 family peptidase [Chitiniphilus sp. CD1]
MYHIPRRSLFTLTWRALTLRGNPLPSWPASTPLLIWLVLLNLACAVGLEMWLDGYPGRFNALALPVWLFPLLYLMLFGQLFGPREHRMALRLPLMWQALGLALTPVAAAGYAVMQLSWWQDGPQSQWFYQYSWGLFIFPLAWLALALVRQYWPQGRSRAVLVGVACVGATVFYQFHFNGVRLWQAAPEQGNTGTAVASANLPLPETALFFQQPELLRQTLERLAPGQSGVIDTYLISVAGHGAQRVFLREASAVRHLFDTRYGTGQRSVLLANSPFSAAAAPMASRDTLAATIKEIGQLMNRDEDLLVIYLTSHGSSDFELSLDYPDLQLAPITPQWLATQLKASGIRWQLIAVSACYSGGFVAPLSGPTRAIVTAADATHTSFGCSDDEEYTFFGKALFMDALARDHRLPSAFASAKQAILQREQAQGYAHSNPQLRLGAEFAKRFGSLPLHAGN